MIIDSDIKLFTFTPSEPQDLASLQNISNVQKIIFINSDDVFLQYKDGIPALLQGISTLETGKGYCIISKPNTVPYELYPSTDDTPDSVTLDQLYQIATYCGNTFDLLNNTIIPDTDGGTINITSQPTNLTSSVEVGGMTTLFNITAELV